MQYNQYKTFDLTKKRPNVLILGNGLTRGTSLSWAKLIQSIGRTGANISQYEEQNSEEKYLRLAKLVKAMLDFGGQSQIQFNHNTENLANSGLDTSLLLNKQVWKFYV